MLIKKSIKVMMLVVLVLALSGFTFALAAANVVPDTKAGDGTGTITGYTVSTIHYVLNSTTPTTIDSVTFSLDTTATLVRVKVGPAGSWSPACTFATSTWTCNVAGTAVSTATSLQVVASN
jgi:hypothetical protein